MATKKTLNKPAPKKSVVKKIAPKAAKEKKVKAKPSQKSEWDLKKKKILKNNPTLTEDDFFRYGDPGDESDESVLRRVADKLGKTYEEIIA